MGTSPPTASVATLLFGQTRRDILALLLGRPDERFYLREILRSTGGGSGGVQRELKQLVDAGLLNRVREGRQVYFSANRSAEIFPELQSIVQKTAGAVDILRSAFAPLVQQESVALALIYGSVANGTQTARSDIDVLVLGSASLAEIVAVTRHAEERLGREVNPSIYPVMEFRRKVKSGAAFLTRVLAGPKLYLAGDDDELDRLVR
ncbi:MAG TPA: nucleotidyltransferase domain-containing protein [Gemmatimonadales bacterium]|jgi:predicted nucleotidyltransferase